MGYFEINKRTLIPEIGILYEIGKILIRDSRFEIRINFLGSPCRYTYLPGRYHLGTSEDRKNCDKIKIIEDVKCDKNSLFHYAYHFFQSSY